MRLSAEILSSAEQRCNPLGEWELILRDRGIPTVEHLGVTRDAFDAMDFSNNRIVSLDNFPRLQRLCHLELAGNLIEYLDANNLKKNIPNLSTLILTDNRLSNLSQIATMGKTWTKLEYLCLKGNPVTRRQHYRLYTILSIPSLRVLDHLKIQQSERDKARRLSQSAAGAALEKDVQKEGARQSTTKTFEPGLAGSTKESFAIHFTAEEKKKIRAMIANASSPQEIEQMEESVRRGIFPTITTTTTTTTAGSSTPPLSSSPPPPPPSEQQRDTKRQRIE